VKHVIMSVILVTTAHQVPITLNPPFLGQFEGILQTDGYAAYETGEISRPGASQSLLRLCGSPGIPRVCGGADVLGGPGI
jgi:hypothetical protein